MNKERSIRRQRTRRGNRVGNKVRGTSQRPRFSVFRSHQHISGQIIDDGAGKTLVAASSQDKLVLPQGSYGGNKLAAEAVGKAIAERTLALGIKQVRFDRGRYKYHGRVAALAEAARQAGLVF